MAFKLNSAWNDLSTLDLYGNQKLNLDPKVKLNRYSDDSEHDTEDEFETDSESTSNSNVSCISNPTAVKIKDAMEINQKMKEKLLVVEKYLVNCLEELAVKKKKRDQSKKEVKLPKKKEKLWRAEHFYKQFTIPYFKDKENDHCPPNADTLQKESNNELIAIKIVQVPWGVEELDIMTKEIGQNDATDIDWKKLSENMSPYRTAHECQRMWELWLNPLLKRGGWSQAEEDKLEEISARYGHRDWQKIATALGSSRSKLQCFMRFQRRIAKREYNRGKWSLKEDKTLQEVVSASTYAKHISWLKVCYYIEDRSFSQIYARWNNSLNVKKARFTPEEDRAILEGIYEQGMALREIATALKGRNAIQVRQRYENQLRPQLELKIGEWTIEEDQKLLELVAKHGSGKWAAIAKDFTSRNRVQVRHRYKLLTKFSKTEGTIELDLSRLRRWKRRNSWARAAQNQEIVNSIVVIKDENDTFHID